MKQPLKPVFIQSETQMSHLMKSTIAIVAVCVYAQNRLLIKGLSVRICWIGVAEHIPEDVICKEDK